MQRNFHPLRPVLQLIGDLHQGLFDQAGAQQDLLLAIGSRQKIHAVKWVDRDGSDRQTTLTQPEVVRLNTIAERLGTSKSELLRRAAHIPVAK